MDEHADFDEEVRAIQRMIAYVRCEAWRLGVFEVALVLDHAVDILAAFGPTAVLAGECDGDGRRRAGDH